MSNRSLFGPMRGSMPLFKLDASLEDRRRRDIALAAENPGRLGERFGECFGTVRDDAAVGVRAPVTGGAGGSHAQVSAGADVFEVSLHHRLTADRARLRVRDVLEPGPQDNIDNGGVLGVGAVAFVFAHTIWPSGPDHLLSLVRLTACPV